MLVLVVPSKQRQRPECMFMSWAEDGSEIGGVREGSYSDVSI